MQVYEIILDPAAASFYQKVAKTADLPIEQVLSDALYRLAGSLSVEAVIKRSEKP